MISDELLKKLRDDLYIWVPTTCSDCGRNCGQCLLHIDSDEIMWVVGEGPRATFPCAKCRFLNKLETKNR